jgi:hypothetical protein
MFLGWKDFIQALGEFGITKVENNHTGNRMVNPGRLNVAI